MSPRFNDDGTGSWLPLTPDSGADGTRLGSRYATLDEILINHGAADFHGVTRYGSSRMDSPVHLTNGDVYLTLTNKQQPQCRIARTRANLRPTTSTATSSAGTTTRARTASRWEIFVFGSDAAAAADTNRSA